MASRELSVISDTKAPSSNPSFSKNKPTSVHHIEVGIRGERVIVAKVTSSRIRSFFTFGLIGCLGLFGCAAHTTKPSSDTPFGKLPTANHQAQAMDPEVERFSEGLYHYLIGELLYAEENLPGALKSLTRASELISQPAPELHRKLAEMKLKAGDLQEALRQSEQAAAEGPDDPGVLILYAGVLDALDRQAEAEAQYRAVMAKDPDRADAFLLLSGLYVKQGEAAKAVELLEGFVKRHPDDATARYFLGRAEEGAGDLKGAYQNLKKAYELDPDNHNIGIDVARIALKNDKPSEAQKVCRSILAKDPTHLLARKVLSQLLVSQNNLSEALEHLAVLQSQEPDPTDAQFRTALILMKQLKLKDAEKQLDLVIARKPDFGEARYRRASIYMRSDRKSEAVRDLLAIGKDDPLYVASRVVAGMMLSQEQKFSEAVPELRQAYNFKPQDLDLIMAYASVLRGAGDSREAVTVLEAGRQYYPENTKLLFEYALALHDVEDESGAEKIMEQVITLDPNHADALNYIAFTKAERAEDLDNALELIQRALAIRPQDGFFLDTLGWILFAQGHFAEARNHLERAVDLSKHDPLIVEHYADVLVKLNELPQARCMYLHAIDRYRTQLENPLAEAREGIERVEEKLQKLPPSAAGSGC